MGNCCGGGEVDERKNLTSNGRHAFQGEGHRLGTAAETQSRPSAPLQRTDDELPEPYHDKNLTDEERTKVRADRAAAAEARLKKQGGTTKKKKTTDSAPLRGPNSEPLMRWTAG